MRFVFDKVDHNGDAVVCWKSLANGNSLRSLYAGDYVDNNAAPK